jgi:CRISPR-associated endonuclease Csn1
MKKILGLDLGTTSLGWALVNEKETQKEQSSIERVGVRIIPLTTDEETDFQKGKSTTLNANRTSKRGARRNLSRFKLRRKALIDMLIKHEIISEKTKLTSADSNSHHKIWELRAKAATDCIELDELARVFLAINKKRGYKSNRKAKDEGDGQAVDGMELAKKLYNENLTPGELMLQRLEADKKGSPDFYRSDLQNEFDRIWDKQSEFYPDLFKEELKQKLNGANRNATYKTCEQPFKLVGIKRTVKGKELKLENYKWRVLGLSEQLDLEQIVIIFQEINAQISGSSGLLSEISDRSKALYFNKQTVGQYLYKQIKINQHTRLKKQVFYRQDYLDEFEKIWEMQAQFHPVLTNKLKVNIRDVIIFYQRRLKSQKGLISVCELEGKEVKITKEGKTKRKTIGPKVCPKSSLLFQEFKIWQKLNDLEFKNIITKEKQTPDLDLKEVLFEELNINKKISANQILKFTNLKAKEGWEINFKNGLDGNITNAAFYAKFKQIVELSGHEIEWTKLNAAQTTSTLENIFSALGIESQILHLNTDLEGKEFTQQAAYQFWHLLYSYEGDDSKTGDEKLIAKLQERFGFEKEYGRLLASLVFKDDYGSLSTKALLKILPHLKAGHDYYKSAALANYNHSNSLTIAENKSRPLEDKLELLPKNSLRNPVVEKILNQLVNVVNAIIAENGKPDEIRIELARELKKSAKERAEMTTSINQATAAHNKIREKLKTLYPFNTGVRITRKDIVKYKLWDELKDNGHKTLYTNTYVPLEKLFSKDFDVEHIIPKARLFDDSFSNKTISTRDFNEKKGNKTGVDAVAEYLGEKRKKAYIERIEKLYKYKIISKSKYIKLKMNESEIPDGFIERDMRNSQYIAKKALELLSKICRKVKPTSGGVTAKLRQDWQLIDLMKELNWDKYKKLGLVEFEKTKDGNEVKKIKDWTKRNDHRHHIMDAITVAFTRPSHVQYFNYLSARHNEKHKLHNSIQGIEDKETIQNKNGKRIVNPPIQLDKFRSEVKQHLENVLVSFKAKNKVTTRNKNKTKRKGKAHVQHVLTPRGQLHKETIYGKKRRYVTKEEKIGSKFDVEKIQTVADKRFRAAMIARLAEFDGSPKKAFTGKNAPSKNPIWLNKAHTEQVPERVKLVELEDFYTIKKEVSPDLKIEKVVDKGVQTILEQRLAEFDGDKKKTFSNLEEKPIWLVKPMAKKDWKNPDEPKPHELGISIKRVTITGVSNAEALHYKKDHLGSEILDKNGEPIPVDFISTGNNHHVAIYKDEDGNLQEQVVSLFEAVARRNEGLPVIDKLYNSHLGWQFLFTMKQNEMFVFPNPEMDFNPNNIDLEDSSNYSRISPNLFRIRKIATKQYNFLHHLETSVTRDVKLNDAQKSVEIEKIPELRKLSWRRIQSTNGLKGIIKVRINHLGEIVKIGEY